MTVVVPIWLAFLIVFLVGCAVGAVALFWFVSKIATQTGAQGESGDQV